MIGGLQGQRKPGSLRWVWYSVMVVAILVACICAYPCAYRLARIIQVAYESVYFLRPGNPGLLSFHDEQ